MGYTTDNDSFYLELGRIEEDSNFKMNWPERNILLQVNNAVVSDHIY